MLQVICKPTLSTGPKGFILRSFQVPMLSTLLVATLFFVATRVWRDGEGSTYLALIAALSVLQALFFILREYLAALSKPALSILCAESFPLALTCGGMWTLTPLTVVQAVSVFALGTAMAIVFQAYVMAP